jgi:hypothetical protein
MSIRIDGTNTAANPGITGADTDTGLQFGTDEIQLVTGGSNRATVESNGNFTIEDGNLVVAAGHGIDFNADANATGMTSELLDDYEEGDWTPTYAGSTTTGSYTYTDTIGRYTKIGNLVHISIRVTNITEQSAANGNMQIRGLPFASALGMTGGNMRTDYINLASGTMNLAFSIALDGTSLSIYQSKDSDNDAAIDEASRLSSGSDIVGSFTYFAIT